VQESLRGRTDPSVGDAPPPSLAIVGPAKAGTVTALRHATVDFVAAHDPDPQLLADVALVVSEAVTNAVKHAHVPDAEGIVELAASVSGGWLEVRIRDRGRGFGTQESDGLGMGLMIIASLVAYLTICQEGHGTEVRMRFPLGDREQ
jgi:anti-sigma regulatory factor (Ser/Thr protein kinase)